MNWSINQSIKRASVAELVLEVSDKLYKLHDDVRVWLSEEPGIQVLTEG